MVKTFDILLDLEKELYSPSSLLFSVSRNDFNTIQLNFIITQDGTPFNLTNKIVELAVKKPSGLTVYQDCEITSAPEGKAQLDLNQQAYIEYGIYTAEVYVREGTDIAVTSPFWYQAKSSIFNEDTEEAIESIADWSALQKALFAYDLKPILVESFPTITPEYVGQMAFDTINEIAYIATDLSNADWRTFGTGEGGGGANDTIFGDNPLNFTPIRIGQMFIDEINENAYIAVGLTANDWAQIDNEEFIKYAVTWGEILEKPTTFTPELHVHEIDEIIGLQTELDLKADIDHVHDYAPETHNHLVAEIDGLQAELDSKANITDVYTKFETYSKPEVDMIVTGITEGGGTVVEDNLNSNSVSSALSANQGRILNELKADKDHVHDYAPENHSHLVQEVEGLQAELDGKADINHNHDGIYSPVIHDHEISEIIGLQAELDGKADDTDLAGKANITHNHEIGEINGLQAELDGKADDTDLAGKADINHNHDASYSPINHNHDGSYAPINHNHDGSYAPINHNHDGSYAPINHNHDGSYLAKTGGEITDRLIINNKGDGKEQIRFDIDRAWSFKQLGIDASSQLALVPDANNKTFSIMSPLGVKTLEVRVSDVIDDGYVNMPVIQENGTKLADKYLLQNAIWTGTQAEYEAIATKDATTLYFVTG